MAAAPLAAARPRQAARRTLLSSSAVSKRFDPGTQLDLPGPGAPRLLQHRKIGRRDGVRIEQAIGAVGRLDPPRTADAAVDHEVRDMNAARRKLARETLRQAAQGELAHGE